LLVAAHHNIERFSAQHHAVSQGVEFCGGGNESWVLALDPYLFFDADVLVFVLERAIGFVVCRRSSAAECGGECAADTEAGKRRVISGMLWFERADFKHQSGVEDEQMKGDICW
jgi:hypothetical protein